MPLIILIKGPAACGKTTIAALLHQTIASFKHIDLGKIKTKYHGDPNRKEKAHAEYYPQVQQALNGSLNIILQESTTTDLKNNLHFPNHTLLSIFLKTSLKTTLKRNQARKKHLDDSYLKTSYPYLSIPEPNDLIIDTETHNPERILQIIKRNIKKLKQS